MRPAALAEPGGNDALDARVGGRTTYGSGRVAHRAVPAQSKGDDGHALPAAGGAMRGLQLHECNTGLVAAANLVLLPAASVACGMAGLTSLLGRCRVLLLATRRLRDLVRRPQRLLLPRR